MIRLPEWIPGAIDRLARAAAPEEACGLLLGVAGPAGRRVVRLVPARNVSPSPRQAYQIDPRDLLQAGRSARAAGLEIVAVWHSHPRGPPRPSALDEALAVVGWSHLIAAPRAARDLWLTAWWPEGRGLGPEALVLVGGDDEPA